MAAVRGDAVFGLNPGAKSGGGSRVGGAVLTVDGSVVVSFDVWDAG